MSSAFDAMDRNMLLEETRNIFDNDEWRMIQKLIDGTTLRVRFGNALSKPFETKWGTPQGDCLSPILFTVYLECALKQLRNKCKSPPEDKIIPYEAVYADDVDLISTSREHIQNIQAKAPAILKEWNLKVNESKLELTKLERCDKSKEPWRTTKKLGTLLGDQEELTRRKQLAAASFKKAKTRWSSAKISENKRLRMLAYFENDVANIEGFVGRPRTTLPVIISQDLECMKAAADERTTQNSYKSRKKTKKEIATEEQLAKLYSTLPNQLKAIEDLKSLEKLANARKKWRQLVDDAHALRSQRAKAN